MLQKKWKKKKVPDRRSEKNKRKEKRKVPDQRSEENKRNAKKMPRSRNAKSSEEDGIAAAHKKKIEEAENEED